jgi:cold shock protein
MEQDGAIEGTVRWFNPAKGYGFILPDSGGEEVFAHYSAIQKEGYRTLSEGERVCFTFADGAKGKQATKIWSLPL